MAWQVQRRVTGTLARHAAAYDAEWRRSAPELGRNAWARIAWTERDSVFVGGGPAGSLALRPSPIAPREPTYLADEPADVTIWSEAARTQTFQMNRNARLHFSAMQFGQQLLDCASVVSPSLVAGEPV